MSGGEFPSTDFAITTVNVPDRLDLRDIHDGGPPTVARSKRTLSDLLMDSWLPRLILAAIVLGLIFLVWVTVRFWMQSLSAESISQRLTATLRVPVRVDSSSLSLFPSPRLQFNGIHIDKSIRFEQGAIHLSPALLARAWQKGGERWADLSLDGVHLTLDQAEELLQLTPALAKGLSNSVGSIHVQGIDILDHPWLTGHWTALVEHDGVGFRDINVRQDMDKSWIQSRLRAVQPDLFEFDLQGTHWHLPAFPSLDAEFETARGTLSYSSVHFDQFSLGGSFGEMHGSFEARDDGSHWVTQGDVVSDSLDTGGLVKQVLLAHAAPPVAGAESAEEPVALFEGAASLRAKIHGLGANFMQAAQSSTLSGQIEVRTATLNGVNLGYLATHPDVNMEGNGGVTRFPHVSANVFVSSEQCEIQSIFAKAGALTASGSFSVHSDLALQGQLHVDLGTSRVLAPIRLQVNGSLGHPHFGK